METNCVIVFNYVTTYILMTQNMKILYFHLPDIHVSNSAYFSYSTLVLLFYICVALTLSVKDIEKVEPDPSLFMCLKFPDNIYYSVK